MTTLKSALDTGSEEYAAAANAMTEKLAEIETEHAKALAGGGEKYTERHKKRGKLLARERIELLLDPDSPFLELCPLAAWGSDFPVGASTVVGIGVVEGVECLIVANDPTVRGGTSNPWTLRKDSAPTTSPGRTGSPSSPSWNPAARPSHAEGSVHTRWAHVPRPHPAVRGGYPDHRPRLRQLDRRRRVHPRHV